MTKDEILDLVLTNIIIQQSDFFRRGYRAAIEDIIDNMIDYAKVSDDELTRDFLHALVDMGESLTKKKKVAEDNLEKAKKRGYTENFVWRNKETFASANIFVKDSEKLEGVEEGEKRMADIVIKSVIASLEEIKRGFGTLDEFIDQLKGEQA